MKVLILAVTEHSKDIIENISPNKKDQLNENTDENFLDK